MGDLLCQRLVKAADDCGPGTRRTTTYHRSWRFRYPPSLFPRRIVSNQLTSVNEARGSVFTKCLSPVRHHSTIDHRGLGLCPGPRVLPPVRSPSKHLTSVTIGLSDLQPSGPCARRKHVQLTPRHAHRSDASPFYPRGGAQHPTPLRARKPG